MSLQVCAVVHHYFMSSVNVWQMILSKVPKSCSFHIQSFQKQHSHNLNKHWCKVSDTFFERVLRWAIDFFVQKSVHVSTNNKYFIDFIQESNTRFVLTPSSSSFNSNHHQEQQLRLRYTYYFSHITFTSSTLTSQKWLLHIPSALLLPPTHQVPK